MKKKISLFLLVVIVGGLAILGGLKLTDMARAGIDRAINESKDVSIAVLSDEDKETIKGLEQQRGSVFVDSRNASFQEGVTVDLLNQLQIDAHGISDAAQQEKYVALFREAAVFLGNIEQVRQYMDPSSDWSQMTEETLTALGLDEYKDNHLFGEYQALLMELQNQFTTWKTLTTEISAIINNGGANLAQREYLMLVERIGLVQNIGAKNELQELFRQAKGLIYVTYDQGGSVRGGPGLKPTLTPTPESVTRTTIDGGGSQKLSLEEALDKAIADFQSRKPVHGSLYASVTDNDDDTVTISITEDGVPVEEIVVKR
ncbi:MAG: hypothetical protein Q4D52_06150 [Eubacteriales bacterium]|nr:hypothetical protein [Eubacteriales bacterium]